MNPLEAQSIEEYEIALGVFRNTYDGCVYIQSLCWDITRERMNKTDAMRQALRKERERVESLRQTDPFAQTARKEQGL